MSRQSRGPVLLVLISPIAPNIELSTLGLKMNLRTVPPRDMSPRYPTLGMNPQFGSSRLF
jgi:hypothetical protein